MQLLMTLNSNEDFHPLLHFDTETETGEEVPEDFGLYAGNTTGLVYSGAYLCFTITYSDQNDVLVVFDIYNEKWDKFDCNHIKDSTSIVSIYPGKLYIDSPKTNSIACVDFDTVNLQYFNDSIHYTLDPVHNDGIGSLCVYNGTWFIASEKKHKIIDLTNDRTVFSDTYKPTGIFFNSNHRLCFLEEERGLFHCGDDIFYVGESPTAVIEDRYKGGYWIACDFNLKFIDYNGEAQTCIDMSEHGWRFNNIVEAEGVLKK